MKRQSRILLAACLMVSTASMAATMQEFNKIPEEVTLLKNVKVFDGTHDKLRDAYAGTDCCS